jgi:hypothetical protein
VWSGVDGGCLGGWWWLWWSCDEELAEEEGFLSLSFLLKLAGILLFLSFSLSFYFLFFNKVSVFLWLSHGQKKITHLTPFVAHVK